MGARLITLFTADAENGYYDEPVANIARFDIDVEILRESWKQSIATSNNWFFFGILSNVTKNRMEWLECKTVYGKYEGRIIGETTYNNWWGLKRVRGIDFPLVEITSENAEEKIFGEFNRLSELN